MSSKYHLKHYEKEHMKVFMLRQEETFRLQVQELHRLYRVQKLLMTDAASAMPASFRCSHDDEKGAGPSKPWDAAACSEQGRRHGLRESELELTLALGCLGKKQETSSSSVDSRTSNSSSSTESGSPGCSKVLPPSSVSDRVGGGHGWS